ncbi:hypothetical protein FGO68_gene1215 [Halteria grandinella]|uniref:Uncharacterized protein n=1 Tax=Halteria grandinella TaxID=5974 RepID=A0A8J8NAV1_HALGN|nr:hypothetical protein FGO68_gene1215 [Halteria grandinella]
MHKYIISNFKICAQPWQQYIHISQLFNMKSLQARSIMVKRFCQPLLPSEISELSLYIYMSDPRLASMRHSECSLYGWSFAARDKMSSGSVQLL